MAGNPSAAERADVYTRITTEIIAAIEAGAGAWRMPWHHDGTAVTRPANVESARRYRGINTLALWIAAHVAGYSDGIWGTYRQWQAAGAQVRKGERATTVVLWKEVRARDDEDGSEDGDGRRRMFARAFSVFNRAQVDGFEPKPGPSPVPAACERLARAEAFFDALRIPMVEGNFRPHYRIREDRIYMPPPEAFTDPAARAGTLMHEAGHATGAKHRLDRKFGERFTRHTLALEECAAELTASYILADLGVAHHPRPDHAAYVASWLAALKDEPRAIFTAAGKAQQAADWMHAQQPRAEEQAA